MDGYGIRQSRKTSKKDKEKRMKRRWITIAAVAAITTGMFAGCGRPDPAETVKKFWSAMAERRYEDAIKYTTKSYREALETIDPRTGMSRKATLFNEWDTDASDVLHIKKFVALDTQIDGNRATVKFEIHDESGDTARTEHNLVWEDGAWRILMVPVKRVE
jgi:hypothetical protein